MQKKLPRMDRYHLVIILCQHYAHCKAYKFDFGPNYFLSCFGPPNHANPHIPINQPLSNFGKLFFELLNNLM